MTIINIVQPDIRHYRVPLYQEMVDAYSWQVRVIHSGIDQSPSYVTFDRCKVRASCFASFVFQHGLCTYLQNADVNIVCFDLHMPLGILSAIASSKRIPVIWWGQGFGKSRLAKHVKARLIQLADAVLLYDSNGKSKIIDAGVAPEKIFVAHNTIWVTNPHDSSRFPKSHLIYVGRLQERKRLDLLIESYSRLKQDTLESTGLVILGDGHIKVELQARVNDLGIGHRVMFIPGTTNDQVLQKWFEGAIAYVSPGDVGLGVLHAFAYGVPVITMQSEGHGPEFSNIENGVNGYIVPPTTESLTLMMEQLIGNREVAQRMGEKAFETHQNRANPSQMIEGFRRAVDYVQRERQE